MSYPSLEQYNEAFQHPQLALSDPELRQGSIATTGLGLPLALCGGFALTYTLKAGAKKFAVRCFHKQSNALEKRYSSISRRLKSLNSPYFVDFEFQPLGVKVAGQSYPVVKMAWATGTTLGQFLEQRYRNPSELQQLGSSLRGLSRYLASQNMAHGDIQPGNVMIADAGKAVQLIDYDGIFVEDLKPLGSAELGHRNFQHPKRSSTSWDSSIDRFSFISLDLSVRVLEAHPDLWGKTQSDGDSILFKANDFADPSRSLIFADLFNRPTFADDARNFAAICKSTFDKTPSLEDFLAKRNIPQVAISIVQTSTAAAVQYLSAYPVLDATSYDNCLRHVGDKVEIIGRVVELKEDKTRHGKPYIFINFGPWQGKIVKISIWSEGLEALSNRPTQSWVGKWISVVGLIEPPYVSRKYKYSHLSISITQGNQLHAITDTEAQFRMAGSSTRSTGLASRSNNVEILEEIRSRKSTPVTTPTIKSTPIIKTTNQAILQKMKGSPTASPPSAAPTVNHTYTQGPPQGKSNKAVLQKMTQRQTATPHSTRSTGRYTYTQAPPKGKSSSSCFIATAVYGSDATETNILRGWRDSKLMPTPIGRLFVAAYYQFSPSTVPFLSRYSWARKLVKLVLDRVVRLVKS